MTQADACANKGEYYLLRNAEEGETETLFNYSVNSL